MGGRTTILQGPAGCGKSVMACLTAVNKPVHVADIDMKIASMDLLKDAIKSGELTFSALSETLAEEGLVSRAKRMAKNEKPMIEPKGWAAIAAIFESFETSEEGKAAGTWVIDSFTLATDHLIRLILFASTKGQAFMSQREWGIFLQMCKETMTALRDSAKRHGKDLIIITHENIVDVPILGDTKIFYDGEGERKMVGTVKQEISCGIPGQFGMLMPRYFEEVYALKSRLDKDGNPEWFCRVHPDNERYLRTSFDTKGVSEFPCDFRKIWVS